MSLLKFFKNYSGTVSEGIGNKAMSVIATWDPEGASEADIKQKRDELTQISEEAQKAKFEWTTVKNQNDEKINTYNRYLAAAKHMQEQMDTEPDPAKKEELKTSLTNLLDQLEKTAVDLKKEKDLVEHKEAFYHEMEKVTIELANKLKTSKKEYSAAITEMRQAQIEDAMAKREETVLTTVQGLSGGGVNSALNAIKKNAQEAQNSAAASRTRTGLLKETPLESDPNIDAALKIVSGEADKPKDTTDRLSHLSQI